MGGAASTGCTQGVPAVSVALIPSTIPTTSATIPPMNMTTARTTTSLFDDVDILEHDGGREREMFYLTTHATHFIYGYMASDIWLRTIMIARKETRCRHMGYSYRLAARVILYAPSHRQDSTYHGLCYTSRGTLAGTRNSSMGPRMFRHINE